MDTIDIARKKVLEVKNPRGGFVHFLNQIKDENELGLILQYMLGDYRFDKLISVYYAYLSYLHNGNGIELQLDRKYILHLSEFRKKAAKLQQVNSTNNLIKKIIHSRNSGLDKTSFFPSKADMQDSLFG